jgi:hypothetical protein
MQVFLCWSGAASHKIAVALRDFLGDVIQEIKPFLSSEDIRKGQRWNAEIGRRLKDTNYGILCLTKDNLEARWILFESGALSKNLEESRVTALLAGVQPTDVVEPLSQFQQTRADKDDVHKLIKDLNELLPSERRLTPDRLARAFDRHWSDLDAKLTNAMSVRIPDSSKIPQRDTDDKVSELLELVREVKREVGTKRDEELAKRDHRNEHLAMQLREFEMRLARSNEQLERVKAKLLRRQAKNATPRREGSELPLEQLNEEDWLKVDNTNQTA